MEELKDLFNTMRNIFIGSLGLMAVLGAAYIMSERNDTLIHRESKGGAVIEYIQKAYKDGSGFFVRTIERGDTLTSPYLTIHQMKDTLQKSLDHKTAVSVFERNDWAWEKPYLP